ncbi:hypothetical protein GCM10010145_61340 [Streptomyces ruber]|uniref:Secreted protein n=2 Tax=Streptomyces TaxID=1883 RepID=A0A918EXU1_9ACTN|nr:hypothetical protein [Streptomyces ruber]GGQ83527.1 hypothetical protein GCM10010145_61340 [Streptomyces ruber]
MSIRPCTSPSSRLHRFGVLAASAALSAAGLVLPATAAHAAAGDLTCTGHGVINFDPALTGAGQTAGVTGDAAVVNCLSPNGSHPQLKNADVSAKGTAHTQNGSPCSLLLTADLTVAFNWDNGQTSTVDATVNTDPAKGLISIGGPVVGGPLKGDTFTVVPVLANPNPDCGTKGLTSLTFDTVQVTFG